MLPAHLAARAQGWYDPAEKVIRLSKPFRLA